MYDADLVVSQDYFVFCFWNHYCYRAYDQVHVLLLRYDKSFENGFVLTLLSTDLLFKCQQHEHVSVAS